MKQMEILMNPIILFIGAVCMIFIGVIIQQPIFASSGLVLMWIGLAVIARDGR